MTIARARTHAQADSDKSGLMLSLVQEGLHADEFAERDEHGESYGYCPTSHVSVLYPYGKAIETITPSGRAARL